ncbi:hypothetical protein N7474_008440 [Penicillium riverlandense]|uniref:uncharacterized protein n=1 Tax=Penicillium riverlandense TaxID=1903569 RepID=UPI002547D4C4|nr:uncharacterized protein N7474_008440 [Penicillium riverlandense]KAJ5812139.1 hypothetical protein N7474_008440 [Penicillium riverlandense]
MSDNTKRHWHGNPGDRYEHLNVWMNGGAKAPADRPPWAMLPGMESTTRRDSDSSTSSTGTNAAGAKNPSIPSVGERRRSSASPGLFANLQSQKRTSEDPSLATRRASWNEQKPAGNYFSKWWEGYTRGK